MILSINIFNRTFVCLLVCLPLICFAAVNKSEAGSGLTTTSFISGPIAVLPVSNFSGVMAPVNELRQLSIDMLQGRGFDILDERDLDDFMMRHRVRYVSGIDRATAKALKSETGAGAALVISLEHYDEKDPPKLAMTFRLVSSGESPAVLWMDSAGLAGDDSPGILGLGLVNDPRVLLREGVRRVLDSLFVNVPDTEEGMNAAPREKRGAVRQSPQHMLEAENSYETGHLSGGFFEGEEGRFGPKIYHRSSSFVLEKDKKYTIAVLPFFNRSERKYAGEIMEQHFLREMRKLQNMDLVEPGLVRNALLKSRVIMHDGISLDNAKVISSMLNADFVLTGTVLSYQDYTGPHGVPSVDFSVMLIERKSGEAIWTSKSYNEGDDSVFFFDFGKVNTAHSMASEMSRAVAGKMFLK